MNEAGPGAGASFSGRWMSASTVIVHGPSFSFPRFETWQTVLHVTGPSNDGAQSAAAVHGSPAFLPPVETLRRRSGHAGCSRLPNSVQKSVFGVRLRSCAMQSV